MTKEKDEIVSARERIKKCKGAGDRDEVINCIYEVLHDITEAQDVTNLTIRGIIDDSDDPRWLPVHITNDANAVILGISESKGNPKFIIRPGEYVDEKMDSLRDKWNSLRWKALRNELD